MVYMHHLKSKRRQVQGYLRWLEPTVWHSSQRRLSSPLYTDWRSLQKALETQREFQQVAARRRSFHQHRGHQKTGRGQSGGSFSRTRYSGVWEHHQNCMADSKENYSRDLGREWKASLKGGCKLNVNVNFPVLLPVGKTRTKWSTNWILPWEKKKVSQFIKSNPWE